MLDETGRKEAIERVKDTARQVTRELEDQKKREDEEEERMRLFNEAGNQEAMEKVEGTARNSNDER